jgi:2-oxoglutarate ferredoxin oxidoreductase subunit alpha
LGSNDPAILEARDRLTGAGVETSYLRLRALPLAASVKEFITQHDHIFVVENNFDGQLYKILVSAAPTSAPKMVSTARCNGMPLSARWITDNIMGHLG